MKNLIPISASLGLVGLSSLAMAASHSDAPMMVHDPAANLTDVYAFIGMNAQNVKVLNVIINVNPLSDPGNGVIYDKFGDDVRYNINLCKATRNGNVFTFDTTPYLSYRFKFKTTYKNPNTILSYGLGTAAGPIMTTGDAQQNFLQTYTVEIVRPGVSTNIGAPQTLKTPPVNVGFRTTPNYYNQSGVRLQGATAFNQLPSYVAENIYTLRNGAKVFAGQREDGFYGDTAGIFDFLGVRNPGKDSFSGYNVHSIAMEIPVTELLRANEVQTVGIFASTDRKSTTVRSMTGTSDAGDWVQVSRMANPLFNEALVALGDKDKYNRTTPDADQVSFSKYANRSELAFLFNAIYGTNYQVNGRTDLAGIFTPDLLKVDLTTAAVRQSGTPGFSRLSFIGNDQTNSPLAGGTMVPSGWPNGRRFGDDVIDIALTAVASGPSYAQINMVGDNVNANDTLYDRVFPYGGTPWGGPGTTLH